MEEKRWVLEVNVPKWSAVGYVVTNEKKGSASQAVYLMKLDPKLVKEIADKKEKSRIAQEKAERDAMEAELKRQISVAESRLKHLK